MTTNQAAARRRHPSRDLRAQLPHTAQNVAQQAYQQFANLGADLPDKQLTSTFRPLVVFVVWNTLMFVRFFMADSTFPVEAMLPAAYCAASYFLKHDELRVMRPSFALDAALATVLSVIVMDPAPAEVLTRSLLVVVGLQWCQIRLAVAMACAFLYLGYLAAAGTAPPPPRNLVVLVAVYTALGCTLAFFLRVNRLFVTSRATAFRGTVHALEATRKYIQSVPALRAASDVAMTYALRPVFRLVTSRWVAEVALWWVVMAIDWFEKVSIGGLAMSACLLVGFGASLAQDRASGRPRYVYQLLLVVAVWASDVSVFLAAPVKTLPFIANCVVSAYFILYCAAPASSPPKITSRPSNTLEITPVPPRSTSIWLPAALWCSMVLVDLYVQMQRGWEDPSLGRIILSVNTIGYGVLMLTSTFLDAFSRDARIRARMTYLDEEAVSADAVAMRQLCEDFEGTKELDQALAAAGVDVRDLVGDSRCTPTFIPTAEEQSAPDTPLHVVVGAPRTGSFAPGGSHYRPPTPVMDSVAVDHDGGDYSDGSGVSDASTTAHSAHRAEMPLSANPESVSGQASFAHSPASSHAAPLPAGAGHHAASAPGGDGFPARAGETAEEAQARERARREQDETRRKAKLQQKLEAMRLHDQRVAEAAERRERTRRETEVTETLDGERRERDSITSKERNHREKLAGNYGADLKGALLATKARKEREDREKARKTTPAALPAAAGAPLPAATEPPTAAKSTPLPAAHAQPAAHVPTVEPSKEKDTREVIKAQPAVAVATKTSPAPAVAPHPHPKQAIVPLPRSADPKAPPSPNHHPSASMPQTAKPAAKAAKVPAATPPPSQPETTKAEKPVATGGKAPVVHQPKKALRAPQEPVKHEKVDKVPAPVEKPYRDKAAAAAAVTAPPRGWDKPKAAGVPEHPIAAATVAMPKPKLPNSPNANVATKPPKFTAPLPAAIPPPANVAAPPIAPPVVHENDEFNIGRLLASLQKPKDDGTTSGTFSQGNDSSAFAFHSPAVAVDDNDRWGSFVRSVLDDDAGDAVETTTPPQRPMPTGPPRSTTQFNANAAPFNAPMDPGNFTVTSQSGPSSPEPALSPQYVVPSAMQMAVPVAPAGQQFMQVPAYGAQGSVVAPYVFLAPQQGQMGMDAQQQQQYVYLIPQQQYVAAGYQGVATGVPMMQSYYVVQPTQ
jgi:hypothetical protein